MAGLRKWLYLGVFVTVLFLALSTFWLREQYLLLSLGMIFLSFLPFFYRFERRKVKAEEMVLIAMLAAIAAVSRVAFVVAPPNVQPASFVIMMTGLVFGAETGFMVGCITALVSNIFLGQGPWTPWQMFGWGMLGFTAGLLRHRPWMNSTAGQVLFGFGWGFLYGWIMNIWHVLGFMPLTLGSFLLANGASFVYDLGHALTNALFLLLFSKRWLSILERMKRKYGLLEQAD